MSTTFDPEADTDERLLDSPCTATPQTQDEWRVREPDAAWFAFRDACEDCFDPESEVPLDEQVLDEELVLYTTYGKVHRVDANADLEPYAEDDDLTFTGEPVPIPDSWAHQGTEPTSDDEARYLAVAAAPCIRPTSGFHSEYDSYSKPPGTVPGVAVLYVLPDASRAFVRAYRADPSADGDLPDPDAYRTGLAKHRQYGDPVPPARQREYQRVLRERYGIVPEEVDR